MHFFDHMKNHFGNVDYGALPWAVLALIVLALIFDFLNGFHDAANSVATIVSTRVLSPFAAVAWAAFFNFIAFLLFDLKVANTMGTGIIDSRIVDNSVIFGTLLAACLWDIITWYWGLPTSSSHALIGGLIGAALWKSGPVALVWAGIAKTCLFILLAPMIGFFTGLFIAVIVHWFCWWRNTSPRAVDNFFRKGQLFSAALYSLGHGGNDAQKTMGIIFVLLIAAAGANPEAFVGGTPAGVPTEVVLACHIAMGVGTLFGGWRIVKTMGQRIIRLRPVDGFCAETGAATTLALTIFGGIPVSTTHTITGSIVGVGSLKRFSAVRWGVAGQVVWAWILTIPACAIIAAAATAFVRMF
ncbi:MAG: inorganic phosphate transporter [Gemmataceae bacterium]|nr:inorganic phosphate transporter [Gemmataceae bacterium]